jgi:hypothetical protein
VALSRQSGHYSLVVTWSVDAANEATERRSRYPFGGLASVRAVAACSSRAKPTQGRPHVSDRGKTTTTCVSDALKLLDTTAVTVERCFPSVDTVGNKIVPPVSTPEDRCAAILAAGHTVDDCQATSTTGG